MLFNYFSRPWIRIVNFFPLLGVLLLLPGQNTVVPQEKSSAAGRCVAVEGALLSRGTASWQPIASKDPIPADHLLVALFGAELHSANEAVAIKLVGDVGERGMFPVLEAAVRMHPNPAFDADLTLERGSVILSNRKKEPVKIRLRVLAEKFDITLADAGSRMGIEIYGRHTPGPPKLTDAKNDVPVTMLFFFALAGEPTVETAEKKVRLQAPPGTALLPWDSVSGTNQPRYFEHVPELAKPLTVEQQQRFRKLCDKAQLLAIKDDQVGKHLDAMLFASNENDARKVAVTAAGALDDLPRLVQALGNDKYADVRDHAVLALRHWLGRASGQSLKLYEYLTKEQQYTPVQAKTVLHLLNGIDEEKLQQPGTYDLLLESLNHSKLPVRELAHWHLVRLAPAGKGIAYDAATAQPQRLRAMAEWRRLIPEGEVPLKTKIP